MVLYALALAVIWVAFFWAKHSRVPVLAQWLRVSSRAWGILLLLTLGTAGLAMQTCQFSGLNALRECQVFSDSLANLAMKLAFASFLFATIYTILTFFIGAILEYNARR